jgi:hypothetical protein
MENFGLLDCFVGFFFLFGFQDKVLLCSQAGLELAILLTVHLEYWNYSGQGLVIFTRIGAQNSKYIPDF